MKRMRTALGLALAITLALAPTALGQGSGPDFAKTEERETYIVSTPEFQAALMQQTIDDQADLAAIAAAETAAFPGDQRNFTGNVCHQRKQECAGDVRLYDWDENGFGLKQPVLFGARSGATISGNVWATRKGPAQRPAVVITTGSVQAPEVLYWSFAQVLAKRGYVVLTYDVQGQGRTDTNGEAPDQNEGVPAQQPQNFVDGTEDALDFLLSTQANPYDPRPSCSSGTDHSPRHERRVEAGLNAAFNPFADLVDADRVGIAGHSLGASAVSYVGQLDPRVDAIVAWDNLRDGGNPGVSCPSESSPRPDDAGITKPALGMSNDYGLFTESNFGDADGQDANDGFIAYKDAGVDSMQVNRRGGTHYEYSFIPGETVNDLGRATLRGNDIAVWYTAAWLNRYVKCQGDAGCAARADEQLLTDRWRDDPREGQVDYGGDPNTYSSNLFSRFDFVDAGGAEQICDDMRAGCQSMAPDGLAAGYSFLAEANTLDEGSDGDGGGASRRCSIAQEGTSANDTAETLPPTDGGDAIRGRGGDDDLRGARGDDCLYGNQGDDFLRGGRDDDELIGGAGADDVNGRSGDDTILGRILADELRGQDGDDMVRGGNGPDFVAGGPGTDIIVGGAANDVLRSADGTRDKVRCNRGARDRVFADRIDHIAPSCELVEIRD